MKVSFFWLLLITGSFFDIQFLNAFQCSRYCKETKNDFGYKPGFVYLYAYEGKIATQINATNDDPIYFGATIQIVPMSTCDYKMQILDTTINSNRNTMETLQNSLYFSFQNGRIDTICFTNDEDTASLNVKRAILSSFQNNMQNKDSNIFETDISGNCETEYSVIDESPLIIKKIKNLELCGNRYEKYFSWQSKPFNNKIKSSSILRSTQSCIQKYNSDAILVSTNCEESHLFQPFSNGKQGVVTLLTQSLEYISTSQVTLNETYPIMLKTGNLLYENHNSNHKKTKMDEIINLFDELELKTKNGVDSDVPRLFSHLIHLMENSKKEILLKVFSDTSERQKKFFIDAISLVTTIEGIEVMKKLKDDNDLSQEQFDAWLSSLVFIKKPTLEILDSLQDLINENSISHKAILTISSLLYRYCDVNKQCEKNVIIANLIKKIEQPLIYGCRTINKDLQEKVLFALKGIGNTGKTASFQQLRNCYKDPNANMELILASIAAHRKIDCEENENLDDLLHVFANFSQNNEIRIAAYLSVMQCTSYDVFSKIKNVLQNEETNQVGSFVWSHLVNLQETSSHWKQGLRHLVENELLKTKFNTDPRKYSRNYETSTFLESINTGISLESNVIFTPDSYLPKSAMLNFTLDLFGETVNMFEFGARLEGFEDFVENFFGPNGYFPEKSVTNLLENARNEHEKIQKLGDGFNSKKIQKEPYGSLYSKIFGNEFSYMQFKGMDLMNEQINMRTVFDKLVKLFKENDVEYTKSFKFLDSNFKIPTLLGFPLQLNVNGTATLGLTVKGKMDLKNIWSRKMNIEGKIYPSAAVEIQGAMTVDFLSKKHGVKYISTLNSNTYLDGHIFIDGGKLVDIQLNVPKKQMDIIKIQSDIFYINSDEKTKMPDVTTNKEELEKCTGKFFEKCTGLKICHKLKYVNASMDEYAPYFPLTGSFKYAIDIKKIDNFTSYNFRWTSKFEDGLYTMDLYTNTPNSKTNRKIHTSVNINKQQKSADLNLSSPFGSVNFVSKITTEYNKYGLYAHIFLNNKELILLDSFLEFLEKYQLQAKFKYKGENWAVVLGNMTTKDDEITTNFKVNDIFNFRSNIKISPGHYEIFSEFFNENTQDGTLTAEIKLSQDGIFAQSEYVYVSNNQQDKILLYFNVNKTRKIEIDKDLIHLNITSTANPYYNTLISFNSQRSKLYFNAKGVIGIFGTTWKTHQLLKFHESKYLYLTLKSSLECVKKNIDYQLILSHNSSEVDFNIHGLLQLNKVQRIETLLKYEAVHYDKFMKILIYYPKQAWLIEGKLNKLKFEEFQFEIKGEREVGDNKTNFLNVDGKYINSTKNQIQNCIILAKIHLDDANDFWKSPWIVNSSIQYSKYIIVSSTLLQINNNKYFTHATWTEDTFTTDIQANDKSIFFIDGKRNSDETNVTFGFNFHQNFEITLKMQPYKYFDFTFFWDKDKYVDKKIYFTISSIEKGFYTITLEYPNQRVFSSIILLPTQITMNVTWGIEVSQKIFFNIGSKVYDKFGHYFGKLETPFEYFENQEFTLKYMVLSQNVEIETNVSWRIHEINFIAVGSRSPTYLTGFIEMNTTLPEISKFGVGVSHTQKSHENVTERITNGSFVYNQHQISAKSVWKTEDMTMSGTFEIVSSSNTINRISGALNVINNETMNYFDSYVTWHDKNITTEYKFENWKLYLIIKTPFEGIENTKFEYALLKEPYRLVIEIEMNILKKKNYVLLELKIDKNACFVEFEVMSPIAGDYKLLFEHSTLYGHVQQELVVKQGELNEILSYKMKGIAISILDFNANLSMKCLGHTFGVSLSNSAIPLKSDIRIIWDNDTLTSHLKLITSEKIHQFLWNLNSSLFDDSIILHYYNFGSIFDERHILFKVPGGYHLENKLILTYPYVYTQNIFKFSTPLAIGGLSYVHTFENTKFDNEISGYLNENQLNYSLSLNIDKTIHFVDELEIKINTSWHKPIVLDYTLRKTDDDKEIFLKPKLHFKFDETKFEIISYIRYVISTNDVFIFMNTSMTSPVTVVGKIDFVKNALNIDFKSEEFVGNAAIILDKNYKIYIEADSKDNKFLLNFKNNFYKIIVQIPKFGFLMDVLMKNDNLLTTDGRLVSHMGNFDVNLLTSIDRIPHQGYFKFLNNNKKFILEYDFNLLTDFVLVTSITDLNVVHTYFNLKFQPTNGTIVLKGNIDKRDLFFILSFEKSALNELNHLSKITITGFYKHNENLLNLLLKSENSLILTKNLVSFATALQVNDLKGNLTGFFDTVLSIYQSNFSLNIPDAYKVDSNFYLNPDSFNFITNATTHLGIFEAEIEVLKQTNNFQTTAMMKSNNYSYFCQIFTNYTSIVSSESSVVLKTPFDSYDGHMKVEIGARNVLLAKFEKPGFINQFEVLLDVFEKYKINGSAVLQLDFIEFAHSKLTISCDLDSDLKELILIYTPDLSSESTLFFQVDGNLLISKIDLLGQKNYIVLNGTHDIKMDEMSLKYMLSYKTHQCKLDLYHINRDYTQTKIHIVTNIKGWEKILFENKLDQDKIRMFLTVKRQFLSLIANKKALFNDKEILAVEYNHDPLLVIFSGREQSYLITSTTYSKYRLAIQYMTNPKIYGFSILNNGENLISLILQNNTIDNINLRGKLIAPILFPKHPNITLDLNSNSIKDLQILLSDQNNKLFEISWLINSINEESYGYFKFYSCNHLLQSFEIHPYVHDFEIKLNLSLKQYDVVKTYDLWLKVKDKIKLDLTYPCVEYDRCNFNLNIGDIIDFHWTSPFENWKNITIKTQLKSQKNYLNAFVLLEKNLNKFRKDFIVDLKNGINVHFNLLFVASQIHNFTFHTKHQYLKYFKLETTYNDYKALLVGNNTGFFEILISISNEESITLIKTNFKNNKFQWVVSDGHKTTTITLIKKMLTSYSDLYQIETIFENDGTIAKRMDYVNTNTLITSFQLLDFVGDLVLNINLQGSLLLNFEKGLVFSCELQNNNYKFSANGNFDTEKGFLNISDSQEKLIFVYEFQPNININLYITIFGESINFSCRHSYKNINSGFSFKHKSKEINFDVTYAKTKDGVSGYVRLPISLNEDISFMADIKSDDVYSIHTKVAWLNQTIEVVGIFSENSVAFEWSSPFTHKFSTLISYDIQKNEVGLMGNVSYGVENIAITGNITSKKHLVLNLISSIPGYTTGLIDAKFDETNRTAYVYVEKENFFAEFEGRITSSIHNVHEINMTTKLLDSANIKMKLDQINMKFNADIQWRHKDLLIDPTDIFHSLTPNKIISMQGTYLKNKNGYELQTDGLWDEMNVRFNGNLNLDEGLKIKSELKVGDKLGKFNLESTESVFELLGYFPKPSETIYLKFDAYENLNISLKTPFDNFRNVNLESFYDENKLLVKIFANVLEDDLSAFLFVTKVGDHIQSKIEFLIPQIEKEFIGETHIELNRDTNLVAFNLTILNKDDCGSKQMLIRYFHNNFVYSDTYNNITIFDDYELTEIYLNLPDVIENITIIINSVDKTFNFSCNFAKFNMTWKDFQVIIDFKNDFTNYINVIASLHYNGFKILLKEYYKKLIHSVNITLVYDEKQFDFNIEKYNLFSNASTVYLKIYILTNFENFFIKFDNFLLDLEKSKFITKVHFLNDRVFINDYIEYDFALTNTSMKLLSKNFNWNVSAYFELSSNATKILFNGDLIELLDLRQNDNLNIDQRLEGNIFYLSFVGNENESDFSIKAIDNEFNFKVSCNEPYLIDIKLLSPYVQDLIIHGETTLLKSNFYIKSLQENVLLVIADFQKGSIELIMDAPKFQSLSYLKFKTAWDGDIYVTINEIKIESDVLGNISVIADLIFLDDRLDITTHLRLPFLENFEKFDAEFHLHKDFNPMFYIHLPNGNKYSFQITYINNNDEFKTLASFVHTNVTLMYNMEVKQNQLILEILTPYEQYKHFVLKSWKRDEQYIGIANLNERIYDLKIDYKSKLKIDLTTPFENYQNYKLHLQRGDNSLICLLYYPGLDREIGFAFIYEENIFKYKLSLPFKIMDYKYHSFSFKFNSSKFYQILSEINDEDLSLNVEFNKIYYLKMDLTTSQNHSLKIFFDNQISTLKSLIEYNNNEVWKLDYFYNKITIKLSCYTIWKSIIFDYQYFDTYQHKILAKLFDIHDTNNQYGGYAITKDKITLVLFLPNKTITINEMYQTNETHEHYLARLAWNKIVFGITFQNSWTKINDFIKSKSTFKLQLPFTTFEFDQNMNIFFRNFQSLRLNSDFVFKWDDETLTWSNNFTNQILNSKLSATALNHDVVLNVNLEKLNKIPSEIKLKIEYSPDVQKLIEIGMFYDYSYLNGTMLTELVMKQPSSNLNYSIVTNIIKTNKNVNLTIFLHYFDYVFNTPEHIKASLEIGQNEFEISGLIRTNRNRLQIFTKSNLNSHTKGLQTQLILNDKEPLIFNYECKFATPSFTIMTGYGDRQYRFYAGLPSRREIIAKLMHNIYGQDTVDGLFVLRLNTSSLLWLQIRWKNEFYEEFSKAIVTEYSDLKFVLEATGQQLIDVVDDNFVKMLSADYQELKKNLTNYVRDQKKIIVVNYNQFLNEFSKSCKENICCQRIKDLQNYWIDHNIFKNFTQPLFKITEEFHKNLLEIFIQSLRTMQRILDEIEKTKEIDIKQLKNDAKLLLKKSLNEAANSMTEMKILAVHLLENFKTLVINLHKNCERLFEPALNLLDDFVAYFENRLAYFQIIILDNLDSIHFYIQNLEEVKEMLKMYNSFIDWLSSLQILEVLQPLNDFIEGILDTLINDIKNVFDDYKPYFEALQGAIFDNFEGMMLPQFNDFKELLNEIYQKMTWLFSYNDVIDNVKAFIHKKSSNLVHLFLFLNSGSKGHENIIGELDYVIRPDSGIIEITQPLPVEWESFDKTPSFERHPFYKEIFNKINSLTTTRFDLYMNTLKSYLFAARGPPANNLAMIVGKSHYITFNDKHFDFTGNCSYVLASDFYSKSFSLVINYGQQNGIISKKSLSVLTNKNRIDIGKSISVNGKKVDLPITVDDFLIERDDDIILIDDFKNLQVACNLHFDYCCFKISSWLFGKIGGLLGTLDNEKSTDFTMSNGQKTNNVEEFAYSWKIDSCDILNYSNQTIQLATSKFVNKLFNTLCEKMFMDSSSSLSACFQIIDPTPYYYMCTMDIRDTLTPTFCRSSAAYKERCKNQHVNVNIPNNCVTCKSENGVSIGPQEQIFDGHNPKSIDVVFIQQINCLNDVITNLTKKLNASLNKKGFKNNRFAFVGYDGLHKPHVYTFDNNIWTKGNNIKLNTTITLTKTLRQTYTVEDAIKYASEMAFRPAVTKMFVLTYCDICEELNDSPSIFNMFGEKDITLHIIKPRPFIEINKDILTIDATKKLLNNQGVLETNNNNEKIIDQIKDMCVGLALSTSGTATDGDILNNNANKRLKTSWASFVSTTAKQSSCQKCKCLQNANGIGKIVCVRCMSPIVKQLLNEYESQRSD